MYYENWLSKQGKQLSKRLMDIVDELREMRDDARTSENEDEDHEDYWDAAYEYLGKLAGALEDNVHELMSFNSNPEKGGLWR